jgi:2',3'-cyclic-nucleotide 2'-phosphodiesterase (5'-nucleotidase family)
VRRGESALGNLVADALREFTRAQVAIVNGGGIRGDRTYAAGTVLTRRDVLTELPFGNAAVVIELSGADLRRALEEGVSAVEAGAGRFPQVSGLAFTFDARRPPMQRVLQVKVDGQPLDPHATYRVATSDYLLRGGDGYASLARGRALGDAGGGPLVATVVMDAIAARGTIAPAVEGRIVEQR